MKILHINKYHYIKGGAESVFFNTEKLLKEHGHQVIPFCLKNNKNLPSPYEGYFVDYPELSDSSLIVKFKNLFSFFYNKRAKRDIEELIKREKPDIAHIHLLFNGISVSILPVLKKYNIPVIMTIHDYRLICPAHTFKNGKGDVCEKCKNYNYFNCVFYRCSSNGGLIESLMLALDIYFRNVFFPIHKYITTYIFVSQFSQAKHQEFLSAKTYNSVQIYNFNPSKAGAIIEEKGIEKKHESYFLFYGRMSKEKGLDCLFEAIKQLPSIRFILIGIGPDSSVIENLPNVNWLGYKTGEELFDYVKGAKFTIVPSTCYENNPMAVVESQSLGTPVIGSNIGGIPELIKDGETGYLFKRGDVEELKKKVLFANGLNITDYRQMINKTLDFATNNYDQETHYRKLLQTYESAIKQKRGSGL